MTLTSNGGCVITPSFRFYTRIVKKKQQQQQQQQSAVNETEGESVPTNFNWLRQ